MRNLLLWTAALLLLATPASGATIGFGCITNSSPGDCAIGDTQVKVDVTNPMANQVLFTFRNTGPGASSIADVYFADGSLLAISIIINGPGVVFSKDAKPPDLPGGNLASPPFHVTAGFSADSDAPVEPNGVNPGEALGIRFIIKSGQTFQNVLDELAGGQLRIGIHVQGFASGGSESFVSTPLPEPGAASLLGVAAAALTGFGTLGSWRRRGPQRSR